MEKDKTLNGLLTIKHRMKRRELNDCAGDMVKRGELEEIYKPLIESNEKTMTAIKKSIELLASQMETINKPLSRETRQKMYRPTTINTLLWYAM